MVKKLKVRIFRASGMLLCGFTSLVDVSNSFRHQDLNVFLMSNPKEKSPDASVVRISAKE